MKCKFCESENIILIQYGLVADEENPEHHDGWSEVMCQDCNRRVGRWTDEELHDGEVESRFGQRGVVKLSDKK